MDDRLSGFFFGKRAAPVLITAALGLAVVGLLGGCQQQDVPPAAIERAP